MSSIRNIAHCHLLAKMRIIICRQRCTLSSVDNNAHCHSVVNNAHCYIICRQRCALLHIGNNVNPYWSHGHMFVIMRIGICWLLGVVARKPLMHMPFTLNVDCRIEVVYIIFYIILLDGDVISVIHLKIST